MAQLMNTRNTNVRFFIAFSVCTYLRGSLLTARRPFSLHPNARDIGTFHKNISLSFIHLKLLKYLPNRLLYVHKNPLIHVTQYVLCHTAKKQANSRKYQHVICIISYKDIFERKKAPKIGG